MNAPSERNALLKAGAGLALVGALALSACAPDDDPAAFDDSEPASAEEPTEDTTAEEESEDEETEESEEGTEPAPEPEEDDDDAAADLDTEEDDADEGVGSDNDEDDDAHGGENSDTSSGPLDHEDAIETIAYEPPGESDVTLEFGFHELRVIDDVMLLEMTIVPEHFESGPFGLTYLNGNQRISPQLTDRENLKQYSRVAGGEISAPAGPIYESGQTAVFWAYYAAPQDDIDTITVSAIPGAVEFEDVEITWGDESSDSSDADTGADQSSDDAADGDE